MICVGTSVSVSTALIHAPLFLTQSIRYVVGAALLLLIARISGQVIERPHGRDWLWLIAVAATGLVTFNIAVVRGVAHAEPSVIAVAVACVPVLLGVVGPLFEGRTPQRVAIVAAVVVTAGGVLVVGTGRTDSAGIAWALLALACEAGFTLLALPVLGRLGAMRVSIHTVWIAAVMLAGLGVATERPASLLDLGPRQWLALLHLAVVVTAVAFVLWYSAVRSLGAGTAGLLTGIAPISAAVTGMALGSGVPSLSVWVGMAVVLGGLSVGLWNVNGQNRIGCTQVRQANLCAPDSVLAGATGLEEPGGPGRSS